MLTKPQVYKQDAVSQLFYFRHLIIIFSMLGIFFYTKDFLLETFTHEQQLTMGLLVFSVYLWTLAPMPTGVSSFLIIAGMLALGLVSGVEEAVIGFLSPALYFILVLSLISHALTKVGIDQAVARLLIRMSKGGSKAIILGLPVFMLMLPLFLPSAVARFKILSPLVSRLNEYYGYEDKSLFKKYCMYVIGMLNQNATMVIFTGGGFSVLAYQLIQDFKVANISWLDWFLRIAPPLWIAMIIVVLMVSFILKLTTPTGKKVDGKEMRMTMGAQTGPPLPPLFWIVTGAFLIMICAWIFTDHDQVPLVLPPMLLVVFYALPTFKLIDNDTIRSYDWENFLLLGSSFSLALLLEANGTARVLASQLMLLIPNEANVLVKILIIALFVFVLRFLFTLPSSAMVVIFPIAISYAELIGVSTLGLAFLVIMIIGGMVALPIHSPTTFYAYQTGVFSKKEQYIIGFISSIVVMLIAVLATRYYW